VEHSLACPVCRTVVIDAYPCSSILHSSSIMAHHNCFGTVIPVMSILLFYWYWFLALLCLILNLVSCVLNSDISFPSPSGKIYRKSGIFLFACFPFVLWNNVLKNWVQNLSTWFVEEQKNYLKLWVSYKATSFSKKNLYDALSGPLTVLMNGY